MEATTPRHDEVPGYVLSDLYADPATRLRYLKGVDRYDVTAENDEHGPVRLGWVRREGGQWTAMFAAPGEYTGRPVGYGRTRAEAAAELLPTARRLSGAQ